MPDPVSSVGEVEVYFLSTLERFLGKMEKYGAAAHWAPNTQQSLITKYTLETRRRYTLPNTKTSIVCGFCSQVIVYFLRLMLLSLRFMLQFLNEGQCVWGWGNSTETHFCSSGEHQRTAARFSSSLAGGCRARENLKMRNRILCEIKQINQPTAKCESCLELKFRGHLGVRVRKVGTNKIR